MTGALLESPNQFGTESPTNNIIPPSENYVKSEQNSMKMSPTSKTMNPIEIANLTEEDALSTPKLLIKNYEKGNKESKFYKLYGNLTVLNKKKLCKH